MSRVREDITQSFSIDRYGRSGWLETESACVHAGIAHGSSGIVYSLASSAGGEPSPHEEHIATETLVQENLLFESEVADRKDMRRPYASAAWCSGSAGIHIARREVTKILGRRSMELRDMLFKGLAPRPDTMWQVDGPDHFFCGNLGRVAFERRHPSAYSIPSKTSDGAQFWITNGPGISGVACFLASSRVDSANLAVLQ